MAIMPVLLDGYDIEAESELMRLVGGLQYQRWYLNSSHHDVLAL